MKNPSLKPLTLSALQAGACSFKQVYRAQGITRIQGFSTIFEPDYSLPVLPLVNAVNWRANGKLKTWKRSPERFRLPIKHGLYAYGEITEENLKLFFIEEEE